MTQPTTPRPPAAPRDPITHREHGQQRGDDYHWLRTDGKAGERVLGYLGAENAYLDAVLAPHARLVDELTAELRSHIQEQDQAPPVPEGDWAYFSRTEEGQAHPVFVRQPRAGGPEQVLLDLNALKVQEGLDNLWVYVSRVSPDARYFAYLLDTTGQEVWELRVLDLATGQPAQPTMTQPPLTGLGGWTLEWGADSRTLYYSRDDETQRPYQLWRHTLGQPQAAHAQTGAAELIYQEDDPTYRVSLSKSDSGEVLLICSASNMAQEWHVLSARGAQAQPARLLPRERGTEYSVQDGGDHWLLLNNHGGASEFQLSTLPKDAPAEWASVRPLLPYDPARHLTGMKLFAGHLLLSGREDGLTRLWVIPRQGQGYGQPRRVEFPEAVYTVRIGANREFGAGVARVLYTSLTRPLQHLDLDLGTLTTTLLKETPVPGYDAEQYVGEQVWVTAEDGERVPVSVVRRRDTPLPAPTLLYGYGSYGIAMDPGFSAARLPLLDRGWVWATAHIRGGSELGRRWYDAGRLRHKMNTFTDFIAAAEGLAAQGVARPGHLAAMGRSAGGLLMGAVVNLRPDLFRAAFVGVPFVDVLSTMLDASIPLTTGEYDEWGNPELPEWYEVMAQYSPYDNLKAGVYPHLFVSGGLNDPRVAYWEPAKYAARVRTLAQPGSGVLVLKTHLGAGHGGSSGRFDALRETAEEYAFLLAVAEGEK